MAVSGHIWLYTLFPAGKTVKSWLILHCQVVLVNIKFVFLCRPLIKVLQFSFLIIIIFKYPFILFLETIIHTYIIKILLWEYFFCKHLWLRGYKEWGQHKSKLSNFPSTQWYFIFISILFQSLSPSFGCLDSYQKLEQLGEGSYATVYKGICRFVLCAEQFVVIESSGLYTMSQIIIVRSEVKKPEFNNGSLTRSTHENETFENVQRVSARNSSLASLNFLTVLCLKNFEFGIKRSWKMIKFSP